MFLSHLSRREISRACGPQGRLRTAETGGGRQNRPESRPWALEGRLAPFWRRLGGGDVEAVPMRGRPPGAVAVVAVGPALPLRLMAHVALTVLARADVLPVGTRQRLGGNWQLSPSTAFALNNKTGSDVHISASTMVG